ncbi:ABC transporter ATP-binding protein [Desulfopila sp. IMCC35006]|uniref:ABC transporter ATP-binding protein n=1 Tax=Desulfopila sp. IMCC35006 TaxID=2569542 RepID=UPI0010AD130C|nr:ABC transporter ATP-binding protein [Desulfopila sp. IMCC35006]TKB24073.1 ABC transporter ATP-binding protein [Desulfopila sp. IMCC35006]
MAPVLDIQNLKKCFGKFIAVDTLSFQVEDGCFFSILGPSGCGKTTLLRMIAGFQTPTEGQLLIRGRDMHAVPPNRRPVNLVFQNLALFPMMNVRENIAFGLKRQKIAAAEIARRVDSMLERVHLPGYGDKDIAQLSGGQKQRVAIARSLVLEPSLLLLDEPLGALDLKLREQMKIELKKLQADVGTTFMYITHDQSEALVMSNRVAVMNHGRFEQIDTPRNLYSNPASRFVAGFVGETNILPVRVTSSAPLKVQTTFGLELYGTAVSQPQGDQLDLFIRPESIILDPADSIGDINLFSLTVRSILFDGSNTKLLATMEHSDFELTVALPQNQQFSHIGKGDTVKAGVHAGSCRCYPRG